MSEKARNIDETRNYLLDEIRHNDFMSKKYKKTCKYLNYVGHLLISAFASLVFVPVGITSSAVEIKSCAITAGTKKYE